MKRAFTLIELLVVITIIGILVAIIVPTLGSAKEKVYRAKCRNHLKQLHIASTLLFAEHKSRFPSMLANEDRVDAILPYMKYMTEVCICPSGPGNHGVYFKSLNASNELDYTFNSNIWLNPANPTGPGLSQAIIADATAAMLAWDSLISAQHDDGYNVVFMDGHAVYTQTNQLPASTLAGIEK